MLPYPHFDPIAFHLGPVKVRWYGIMYLVGFALAWIIGGTRVRKEGSGWTMEQYSDYLFYGALGVILGGRIGYMLFYNLPTFIHHPLTLFQIWDGGMSFHGGLLGVMLATWFFARRTGKHFLDVTDFIAPLVPLGLGAGRIGNFINGELWGRVTHVPWGVVFPHAGPLPRHPSQLYEFFMEGVCLFTILWFFSAKPRPRMAVSALFLVCYGSFRIIGECFRQPDPQYGFIAFGWLTMGQILSFPMVLLGIALLCYVYGKKKTPGDK